MPGDKPWQTRRLDSCVATNLDNRWSDIVLLRGISIAGSAASYAWLQGKTARSGTCREIFLLTHFPWPVQSVSIRGVSTKLKVNSGRTNPPVSLPKGSLHRASGIDHLDGFQVNLAPTQPLNRKQRVLLRLLTLLEPTCKLIRIFTPGPEPLPLMCCLPS
jgi:hypothetical protein